MTTSSLAIPSENSGNQLLPLSVSYGLGGEQIRFQTGETKSVISHKLSDPKLVMSARYVNLAGELLWSLRIELAEAEGTASYQDMAWI